MQKLSPSVLKQLNKAQRNEISEYYIYSKLAKKIKNKENSQVLVKIANEEKRHAEIWEKYTDKKSKPYRFKVFYYVCIARFLGLTFGIKLMEKGEEAAQINYDEIAKYVPDAKKIAEDEDHHEKMLIDMLDEEGLKFMGSVVLGLNDALVELTGALAGFTFAIQNTNLIAIAGLITGIAASFSMAVSEYLSTKAEGNSETALKASVYTGIAYIFTVFALILPYLFINNIYLCLALTLTIAICIIFFFNFYIAIAKDLNFFKRFSEMAILSLGVSAISFGIGILIRTFWDIEI